MTVENLWYNGKRFKGVSREKMGPAYKYEYDLKE